MNKSEQDAEFLQAEIDIFRDVITSLRRFLRLAPIGQVLAHRHLFEAHRDLVMCFHRWPYALTRLRATGHAPAADSLEVLRSDVLACSRQAYQLVAADDRGAWPNNLEAKMENLIQQVNVTIRELKLNAPDVQREAYIPFSKALELSNGVLTRKKLEKAINEGEPVKVRDRKPSPQRRDVHIQDVLTLTKKLSGHTDVTEEAARMFGEYVAAFQAKQKEPDLR